jgi:hypothetical protein
LRLLAYFRVAPTSTNSIVAGLPREVTALVIVMTLVNLGLRPRFI